MGRDLGSSVVVCTCLDYFSIKDGARSVARIGSDTLSIVGSGSKALRESLRTPRKGIACFRSRSRKAERLKKRTLLDRCGALGP